VARTGIHAGADWDVAALEGLAAGNVERVVRQSGAQRPSEIPRFLGLKTVAR
jgi:hypothetical protein